MGGNRLLWLSCIGLVGLSLAGCINDPGLDEDGDAARAEDGAVAPDLGERRAPDAGEPPARRPDASVPTPCLEADPAALEFRSVLVGREDTRHVTFVACSEAPLEIGAVEFVGPEAGAFSVTPAQSQDGGRTWTTQVVFSPRVVGRYAASLRVHSDDPERPVTEVRFVASAVLNACPQPLVAEDTFIVSPLDTVTLDGSPSIDSDGPSGRPVEYVWVVTSRPEGSTSQPAENFFNAADPAGAGPDDDVSTPTVRFFVDLQGRYTLELRVRDNLGLSTPSPGCPEAAVVGIVTRPPDGFRVRLTWETDEDLDLHVRHPNASTWFEAPWDVYYQANTVNWGDPNLSDDDPQLTIDALAFGPEEIVLNQPEPTDDFGVPYIIGVSRGRVAREVAPMAIEVRFNGELAGRTELVLPLLMPGVVQEVGRIHWRAQPELELE